MGANAGHAMLSEGIKVFIFLLSLHGCLVELSARVFLQLVEACNSFLDADANLCANTPGQATLPLLSCQDVALDLGRRARQPADAADVGRVTLDRHLATQILQCAKEYVSWPQPTHNLHVERRLKLASSIDANLASHVDD